MSTSPASPFNARAALGAAWPLFQRSWPTCLPLALVGVAASAVPGAEAVSSGETHGFSHSPQWWALYAACMTLMLLSYGAVLLRQLSLAAGQPLPLREALQRAVFRLPAAAATMVLVTLAVVVGGVLLVVPGLLALVYFACAWHVVLWEGRDPVAALARSIALTRGRAMAFVGVLAAALAAVLVFVMLTGILLGVVMSLAGIQPVAGDGNLGVARLIYAVVLAIPVVWLGAVSTVTYRWASGRASGLASGQP
jgi:hypothetical protein